MSFAPFWSFIFFLTLWLLGINSVFATLEAANTGILDIFRAANIKIRRESFALIISIVLFCMTFAIMFEGEKLILLLFTNLTKLFKAEFIFINYWTGMLRLSLLQ